MKYHNLQDIIGSVSTIRKALEEIKSEKNKGEIEDLRKDYINDRDSYDAKKKKLTPFAFAGTFKKRNNRGIDQYIGLAILDIDKIQSIEEVSQLKRKICSVPYTAFCFVSPSGHGLKIGVFMDCDAQSHKEGYVQVKNFYESRIPNIKFDKTSDLSRLCLTSYDPDLYQNTSYQIFDVIKQSDKSVKVPSHVEDKIHFIIDQLDSVEEYVEGNRNKYIYLASHVANRHGIEKQKIIEYFLNFSELDETEIKSTIESAYKNKPEFGILKYDYAYKNGQVIRFPDEIYDNLPEILKIPLQLLFGKERDMALLSFLTYLSSIFYNLKGEYRLESLYPNLISMIIAPPASGKSIAAKGDLFMEGVAQSFDDHNLKNQLVRFRLAGNSSSAMLTSRLGANKGVGMIFESEGDSISNNKKSEWGDISVLLRNAYHNERYLYERKKDYEMVEIERPRFSFLSTMTPNQLPALLESRQNGLFSRVLFYIDQSPTKFDSLNPNRQNKKGFQEALKNQGEILKNWFDKNRGRSINFNLKDAQWDRMDEIMRKRLDYWLKAYGNNKNDIILRLSTSSFKIMMTLSTLRQIRIDGHQGDLDCLDIDFKTAVEIVDVLFYHALNVEKLFTNTSYSPKSPFLHNRTLNLIKSNDFTTAEYLSIFEQLSGSRRTGQRYLDKQIGKTVLKVGHGKYQKIAI